MNKVLVFGSMNIDNVYSMEHFVRPGETLSAVEFRIFPGGKGLNQSIALAKAGCDTYHAGKIGNDGKWLLNFMEENRVDISLVERADCDTGKAIIQVNSGGQNCIILYHGANHRMDKNYIDRVLDFFNTGDFLLLQNEINEVPYIITAAYKKGIRVILNPSPITDEICKIDFTKLEYLILNEVEGETLTGEKEADRILDELLRQYPNLKIILTLGSEGSVYYDSQCKITQKAYQTQAVDTTAAGDTFTGYFFRCISNEMSVEDALRKASLAAGISVESEGAAISIPEWKDVLKRM